MRYLEIKKEFHDDFGKLPLFFAFNKEQFNEGMKKLNLETSDFDKIIKMPSGGFVLKSVKEEVQKVFDNYEKGIKEISNNKKELIEALVYELGNTEYCIGCDSNDALKSFSLKLDTLTNMQIEALSEAIKIYWEQQKTLNEES